MRLIDADDVIKYCCSSYGQCCHECEKCGFANSVEYIPTAYDVDKVVEELDTKRYGEPCEDAYEFGYDQALYEAIDIVREGGNK